MDVDIHATPQQEMMSGCRSFASNYQSGSQSRKMSIGVLVDSIGKAETKDIKEAVVQMAEKGSSKKGNCGKVDEGHSLIVGKHHTVTQTSPWVSTRSFNQKMSSSIAVHDTEHTPSFPATKRTKSRAKLLEKTASAHSVKFFAGRTGLGSDEGKQKNFGKSSHSMDPGNITNAENAENLIFSNGPGNLPEKEQGEDVGKKTETGGRETLRMKLWEILGNDSSSNKQCSGSQPARLHPDKEIDREHNPIEKRNPNSDTIESDSSKSNHTSKRPQTRSLIRKKANSKHQHTKVEATKSTSHKRQCQRKRIFSFKVDCPERLYDNVIDGSLPSKRKRIERESSKVETQEGHGYVNAERRERSENKSRSIPSAEKSVVHRNKVDNANSFRDRRTDVFLEPKSVSKNNIPLQFPLNPMTEQQRDDQNLRNVGSPSRSVPAVEKSVVRRNKAKNANSSSDRINDVLVEPKSGVKKNGSFQFPLDAMTEKQKDDQNGSFQFPLDARTEKQKDDQQPRDVGRPSRSVPAVEKSVACRNKVNNANSSSDRRNDVFVEPKSGAKKNDSFQFPLGVMTKQQKDDQQMRDVGTPTLMDHQENIARSMSKKGWSSVHDPPRPTFEVKSPGCLQRINQGKLHDQNPADKIFNIKGIRRFNSFVSSKSAKCKPDANVKSSDGGHKLINKLEEDSENRTPKLSADVMGSKSSEDDSHVKACRKSKNLSPEICFAEMFLHVSDQSLGNKNGAEVTGCSPMSESLKGTEDSNELKTYMEQNHDDGLAGAVALFAVALGRVKTKLKSLTSKRTAEILGAAAEEILLQLQNTESQIKKNVGKLSNFSQSKRKRVETKFQEQEEELLGIYKRFKEAVDQHLQDYGGIIKDLEEHEMELERTTERLREAQKMFLSQVEQEIKVQLDDAETRIVAVQKAAREKMLRLKLLVAECVKYGAFG